MITTPDLIDTLTTNPPPVRRLYPPLVRTILWVLFVMGILSFLAVSQGFRRDLLERLTEPSYAMSVLASLLTGVFGAYAAFMSSLPDRSRLWCLLPLPFAVVWISSIGYQCFFNWMEFAPVGFWAGEVARCFATVLLTSVPLSLVMIVMLRHAAMLRPATVIFTGCLAVSGITAAAMSMYHVLDASVMILVWNLGVAALILLIGRIFGMSVLSLVAPRATLGRD